MRKRLKRAVPREKNLPERREKKTGQMSVGKKRTAGIDKSSL